MTTKTVMSEMKWVLWETVPFYEWRERKNKFNKSIYKTQVTKIPSGDRFVHVYKLQKNG